mgnify:CR=1 FL=1
MVVGGVGTQQRGPLDQQFVRERPTDCILFVCIAMDISARPYKGQAFIEGTSNPGIITHQWGGVGRCVP